MSSRGRRTKLSTMFEEQTTLSPKRSRVNPSSPLTPGWISGKLAVFTTPPSAKLSPKGRRTRRSSVYMGKKTLQVSLTNLSEKKSSSNFKIPTAKLLSPPGVKTRARRSSIYIVQSRTKSPPHISLSVQEMAELVRSTSSDDIPNVKGKKTEPIAQARGKSPVKQPTNKRRKVTAKKTPAGKSRSQIAVVKSRKEPAAVKNQEEPAASRSRSRSKKESQKVDSKKTPTVEKSLSSKKSDKMTPTVEKSLSSKKSTKKTPKMEKSLSSKKSTKKTPTMEKSSSSKKSAKKTPIIQKNSSSSKHMKSTKKSAKTKVIVDEEGEDVLLTLSALNEHLLDENSSALTSGKKSSSKAKLRTSEKKKSTKKVTKSKSENLSVKKKSTKKVTTSKSENLSKTATKSQSENESICSDVDEQNLSMTGSIELPSRISSPLFTPVKNLFAMFGEYRSPSSEKTASPKVVSTKKTPSSSPKVISVKRTSHSSPKVLSAKKTKSSTKTSMSTPEIWKTPVSSSKTSSIFSRSMDTCSALFRTPVGSRTPLSSTPTTFTNLKSTTKTSTTTRNACLQTPDIGLDRKRKTALTPFYESMAAKRRRIGDGKDLVTSPLSVSRTSFQSLHESFTNDNGDENSLHASMDDDDFNRSDISILSHEAKPQSWCSLM